MPETCSLVNSPPGLTVWSASCALPIRSANAAFALSVISPCQAQCRAASPSLSKAGSAIESPSASARPAASAWNTLRQSFHSLLNPNIPTQRVRRVAITPRSCQGGGGGARRGVIYTVSALRGINADTTCKCNRLRPTMRVEQRTFSKFFSAVFLSSYLRQRWRKPQWGRFRAWPWSMDRTREPYSPAQWPEPDPRRRWSR